MRVAVLVGIALILMAMQSVLVKILGLDSARLGIGLAVVVFLGLRIGDIPGALGAFAVGYFLDVLSGYPSWLYPFLSVAIFAAVRIISDFADSESRGAYTAIVALAVLLHALLAGAFAWLTGPLNSSASVTLPAIALEAAITALAAFVLWPLFRLIEPKKGREERGALI